MNVNNQYKQNKSLKMLEGREDFVLGFSAQANRGTPQMLRFSETVESRVRESI